MIKYLVSILFLLILPISVYSQDISLSLEGQGIEVISVDKVVIVKQDVTVVTSFPFKVAAPKDDGIYFWQFPAGVQTVDKGNVLEILKAPKGSLTITVKCITADWVNKKFITRFGKITFNVNKVPEPDPVPPDPGPDPVPPEPKPDPTPFPGVNKLHVLFIFETNDVSKYPAEQHAALYSKDVQDWLDKNADWRKWDKDVDTTYVSKVWQDAMRRNRDDTKLPWIIIGNAKTGYEGPMPTNINKTLELLKKYGD